MKKSSPGKSDSQVSINSKNSYTGSEGSEDFKGSQSDEDYGATPFEDEGSDHDT